MTTDLDELTVLLADVAREHGWNLEWDYRYGSGTGDDPAAHTVYLDRAEPATEKPIEAEMADALDLDAIEQRANAATDGPWLADVEIDGVYAGRRTVVRATEGRRWRSRIVSVGQTRMHVSEGGVAEANVAFIAAARTDVPALVQRVRDLEAAATP